jgi:integrase
MLTEKRIRDAKPEAKTRILWDSQVRGLGARVTEAGVKSYILNYRVAGRERRATLARCSELSLRAARERAGRELAAIRAGESDPLERQREARSVPTVADGLDRFFGEFAPERVRLGRMTPRTVEDYGYAAKGYIRPALGLLKVKAVTRQHVERMVSRLPPTQRNRVLGLASRLFNQFERWEWRDQNTNPARGIERARETPRDRTLTTAELGALSAALDQFNERVPASVAAIRVAAITGLRIGEVLAIQWEHVDFESGRLTMPGTKTGRRQHDLPAAALAVLSDVPRLGPFAFTTNGKVPITYRTAHVNFRAVVKAAGLEDVRLHDLRRTVMTAAARAGIGTHILRDLLGHRTTAMADRYIRSVGAPVREAREQIGAEIAAAMAGEGGRVMRFRRRG